MDAVDLPETGPDDVLGQATRARLFAMISDLGRPAGTDEMAQRLGMHPNGVRIHLERLYAAGLLVKSRQAQSRGRPRDVWSVSTSAEPGGSPPRAYGDLARWLARATPPTKARLREVEDAGRQIGRELAPTDAASPEAALRDTLTGLGFQPALKHGADGQLCCRLDNCPYRNSVKENREVVCTLHRGITRGILDVIEPRSELTGFIPKDPDTAGCEVHVEGLRT
jgi:predicted ArsR family transcriptional regulator